MRIEWEADKAARAEAARGERKATGDKPMLSSIRSDPWWQPPNDGLQPRQRERITAQRLAAHQRRDARATMHVDVTQAACKTLLFMVNCVQAHQQQQQESTAVPHVWNADAPTFMPQDRQDDGLQDEGEAMADLRAAEASACEQPPTEQDENAVEGGLSREFRDRIEMNRKAAIQRRNDRRVYGPAAPKFTAEKSYQGLRENRVFKTGVAGLGYYMDEGPTQPIELLQFVLPMEAAPLVPLELHKLLPDKVKPHRRNIITTPSPCRRRMRPRKQGVVGFEAALHEEDPIWPSDGSLSMYDDTHRVKGMYAIDTVNPNAWPAAEQYCVGTAADFVCVSRRRRSMLGKWTKLKRRCASGTGQSLSVLVERDRVGGSLLEWRWGRKPT